MHKMKRVNLLPYPFNFGCHKIKYKFYKSNQSMHFIYANLPYYCILVQRSRVRSVPSFLENRAPVLCMGLQMAQAQWLGVGLVSAKLFWLYFFFLICLIKLSYLVLRFERRQQWQCFSNLRSNIVIHLFAQALPTVTHLAIGIGRKLNKHWWGKLRINTVGLICTPELSKIISFEVAIFIGVNIRPE